MMTQALQAQCSGSASVMASDKLSRSRARRIEVTFLSAGQSGDVIASVLGHSRGSITLDLSSRGPGRR